MKHATILLTFLAFAASPAAAQKPSPTPVKLPKPIMVGAPSMSKWTVTTLVAQAQAAKGSGAAAPKPVSSGKQVFTKTDPVRSVVTTDSDGRESQQWCVGSSQFVVSADGKNVGIVDPASPAYIKGDFAGLDWIKESNYTQTTTYQGHECWVFRGKVSQALPGEIEQAKRTATDQVPFDESKFYAECTAYIDTKTRLPVLLQRGDETFVYTFEDAPTETLIPPEAIQQRLVSLAQRSRAMRAGPPRAF